MSHRPPLAATPTPPAIRLAAALALAAALSLLGGCLVLPAFTNARTGALLPEDRLAALTAGTTRREVLDWFGPPLAVVRRGTGAVRLPDVSLRTSGGEEVPAARFFERFGGQADGPDDLVYFYRAHQLTTRGYGMVMGLGNRADLSGDSSEEARAERLWILLDGATGLVRAHVLEREALPAPTAKALPAGGDRTRDPGGWP